MLSFGAPFLRDKMQNSYKYIHLMSNDKFAKPFVQFLNKNYDTSEHLVLCKRFFRDFPFPEGENVLEIKSYREFDFYNPQIEKIICHSLFDEERVQFFYKHQELLQEKTYWQIWGGDLYDAPTDEINTFVRKNFKGYITMFDEAYARKKYGITAPFYPAYYVTPMSGISPAKIREERGAHEGINIQINNSADVSTIEILEMLKKFRKENMKIYTVLSYGQMKEKDSILQKGKEIFGQKFIPLLQYLPAEEYMRHLANLDVLILNQSRQQAGANAHSAVHLGIKLFIHDENTIGTKLKNDGLSIYNPKDIENMDFQEFFSFNLQEENIANLKSSNAKRGNTREAWQRIFDA